MPEIFEPEMSIPMLPVSMTVPGPLPRSQKSQSKTMYIPSAVSPPASTVPVSSPPSVHSAPASVDILENTAPRQFLSHQIIQNLIFLHPSLAPLTLVTAKCPESSLTRIAVVATSSRELVLEQSGSDTTAFEKLLARTEELVHHDITTRPPLNPSNPVAELKSTSNSDADYEDEESVEQVPPPPPQLAPIRIHAYHRRVHSRNALPKSRASRRPKNLNAAGGGMSTPGPADDNLILSPRSLPPRNRQGLGLSLQRRGAWGGWEDDEEDMGDVREEVAAWIRSLKVAEGEGHGKKKNVDVLTPPLTPPRLVGSSGGVGGGLPRSRKFGERRR